MAWHGVTSVLGHELAHQFDRFFSTVDLCPVVEDIHCIAAPRITLNVVFGNELMDSLHAVVLESSNFDGVILTNS